MNYQCCTSTLLLPLRYSYTGVRYSLQHLLRCPARSVCGQLTPVGEALADKVDKVLVLLHAPCPLYQTRPQRLFPPLLALDVRASAHGLRDVSPIPLSVLINSLQRCKRLSIVMAKHTLVSVVWVERDNRPTNLSLDPSIKSELARFHFQVSSLRLQTTVIVYTRALIAVPDPSIRNC